MECNNAKKPRTSNLEPRIAVIGAGPAGITMALELKKRGYTEIVIFGDPDEAQYKTIKVEDVSADVGTSYFHLGYADTIYELVKRAGVHVRYLAPAEMLDSSHQPVTLKLKDRIVLLFMILWFQVTSIKWRLLRNTVFSKNASISMEEYLNKRGLKKLANSIVFSPGGIAQGYGFLNEVTAYHLLQWFSFSIFLTPIGIAMGKGLGVIVEGYGELFSRLLAEQLLIKKAVRSVQARFNSVSGRQEVILVAGDGKEYEFDHVVIACPLDKIDSPAASLVNQHTKKETRLFSFCWVSTEPPFFKDRIYYTNYMSQNEKNKILTVRFFGKTLSGLYVYWGVGYVSDEVDEESLQQALIQQISMQIKLKIKKIHFFKIFNYNLRFTEEAIAQGIHLQLRKLQGVNHIWYSGGMLSHWDIDSISEFNKKLALDFELSESSPSILKMIKYRLSRLWYTIQEM